MSQLFLAKDSDWKIISNILGMKNKKHIPVCTDEFERFNIYSGLGLTWSCQKSATTSLRG
jgi:hypothetical protein